MMCNDALLKRGRYKQKKTPESLQMDFEKTWRDVKPRDPSYYSSGL